MAIRAETDDLGCDCDDAKETVVAEINITPLTDVFLVLLVIFMVTSTAMAESKVPETATRVTPLRSNVGAAIKRRTDPVITVTRANEIFLDAEKVALTDLEAAIGKALSERASDTVLIRGDVSAPLGAAVQAMSLARKAGAQNIHVLTSPPQ
jgi:biopolymer transport protein ExbD